MKTQLINPNDAHIHCIQSRIATSQETIGEYAELMTEGVQFDPCQAVQTATGDLYIWDGKHRREAAVRSGAMLLVSVVPGTLNEAVWKSLSANKKHGLRRTREDVVHAVQEALRLTGQFKSDREIASWVGCDHKTVGKYRKQLQSSGEIPQMTARKVTRQHSNGTSQTYQMTIPAQPSAAPVPKPEPAAAAAPEPEKPRYYYTTFGAVAEVLDWFPKEKKVRLGWYDPHKGKSSIQKLSIDVLTDVATQVEYQAMFDLKKPRECRKCLYWSCGGPRKPVFSSPLPKIPGGKGHCCRIEGPCDPDIVALTDTRKGPSVVVHPEILPSLTPDERKTYLWKCARCGVPTEWGFLREYKGELCCCTCLSFNEEQELNQAEIERKAKEARDMEADRQEQAYYKRCDVYRKFDATKKEDRNAPEYWFIRQDLTQWQLFLAERFRRQELNAVRENLDEALQRNKKLEQMYSELKEDFETWLQNAKGKSSSLVNA